MKNSIELIATHYVYQVNYNGVEYEAIVSEDGKEILIRKFNHIKVNFNSENVTTLERYFKVDSATELYYRIATNKINIGKLRNFDVENHQLVPKEVAKKKNQPKKPVKEKVHQSQRGNIILIGDDADVLEVSLSKCCRPIPGDDIFGFITISRGVKIHRQNCPNAMRLMANYAYRIIKAKWADEKAVEFLASIKFTGIDDIGLVNKITNTISQQLNINMRAIKFESKDGVFRGRIDLFITDTEHLKELNEKLSQLEGIHSVERIENPKAF